MIGIVVLLGIVAAVVGVPAIRQKLITSHLMVWVKKSQPKITPVERDVLDSGNVWVERAFFEATPDFNAIIHDTPPALTAEEQRFIDNQVTTFCSMLDDWQIIHQLHDLPATAWEYIKKEKFWGLIIAKEYGGLQFSALAHSQIILKIASKSMSAALTVMVPNSLGPAEFLQHYGSDEQKKYYLPRLATGEEVACFALTALNAGSDATALKDTGVVCEALFEGKKTLGIKLNFDKRYITLAPVATLAGVAFPLYDPNHLMGEHDKIGITLALVPTHLPGVSKGSRHHPLDLGFMNGPIRGKDVFIPLDYLIGGVANAGKGWRMLMECLSVGRSISLPALATAAACVSYRMASAYSVLRKQFRRSIGEFEGVQLPLAHIGGLTYLCDALRLMTLEGVDRGLRPAIASAIAKHHATELGRIIVNLAMDIHGGRGIQQGPRNYLANLYMALPMMITVEGANILTRSLIIYGQGALRCHPYLQYEIESAMQDDSKQFDKHITQHGLQLLIAIVRVLYLRLLPKGSPLVSLQRLTVLFRVLSDVTMAILGKQLKFKESTSGRLGDMLSHLYMALAALKYFDSHGKPESETVLLRWAIDYCFAHVCRSARELCQNYPVRWLGNVLAFFMLPRCYEPPSDTLSIALADFMQTDTVFRARLTSSAYMSDNLLDPCYRVERAWQKVLQSQGSMTADALVSLVNDALQVDEFDITSSSGYSPGDPGLND